MAATECLLFWGEDPTSRTEGTQSLTGPSRDDHMNLNEDDSVSSAFESSSMRDSVPADPTDTLSPKNCLKIAVSSDCLFRERSPRASSWSPPGAWVWSVGELRGMIGGFCVLEYPIPYSPAQKSDLRTPIGNSDRVIRIHWARSKRRWVIGFPNRVIRYYRVCQCYPLGMGRTRKIRIYWTRR